MKISKSSDDTIDDTLLDRTECFDWRLIIGCLVASLMIVIGCVGS